MTSTTQPNESINNVAGDALLQQQLTQHLENIAAGRAAFSTAKERHGVLSEQIVSQEKAAQASEAEAQEARQKLREALRECVGRPTKKLFELKADARAAYSLAEEYRSLSQDIAIERERAEIAMHEAARDFREGRLFAMRILADHLLEVGFSKLPIELLASLKLQHDIQSSPIRKLHTFASDKDYVLANATRRLNAWFDASNDNFSHLLPAELTAPLDASGYGELTHLGLQKLKDRLEATERELMTHEPELAQG